MVKSGLFFLMLGTAGYGQVKPLQRARWISAPDTAACPVFVKSFLATKHVESATLTITVHGIYEAQLNDKRIGEAYFCPGFTSYAKRLQYQSYDVSRLLKPGRNIFMVTLSGGWYSGVFGGDMQTDNYGKGKSLLCALNIIYTDGSRQIINSDKSWKAGDGPIKYADFYNGEFQDTRFKTGNLKPVIARRYNKSNLVTNGSEPVTEQEHFSPKRIFKSSNGETVVDFGQNLAGFVRLKVKGKAGDTITIGHGEMLDKDGNFYTGNLREAKAIDVYVLNGHEQVVAPHFTYHGFRYARVRGFKPTLTNCMAIAVHSRLKHTGTFSCSDSLINQLQHNVEWSLNSNFMDIPTDCPQRSERLGWTGDAQIFCITAAFNRDVRLFYKKYLADLAADQGVNGGVPNVIPDLYNHQDSLKGGVAGWGDAAVIVPWTLYEVYGEKNILHEQYASMKAWVNYIQSQSKDDLWQAGGYGDWYAPGEKTSLPFLDQCFYAHSLDLLIRTAQTIHQHTDVAVYSKLRDKVRTAFLKTYVFNDTSSACQTQTACVMALQFNLLPDSLKGRYAKHLVDLIHQNKDHLATGFLGTPYLLPVLTANGYTDVAYALLNQTSCPSWLYPVKMGATTIWERWDAERPDSTLQQTSFNHYAYGAVGQWFYEDILGIQPAMPGYKMIRIAPHPGGGLTWVKGSYTCKYGKITSCWTITGHRTVYDITIPRRTSARIELPGQASKKVKSGIYHYTTIAL